MARSIYNGIYLLNILHVKKEIVIRTKNKSLSGFNINQHALWNLHMIYMDFFSLVQDADSFVITVQDF